MLMVDSPVYLIKQGRTDAARQALLKLYGSQSPDVEARLANIQLTVAMEKVMHSQMSAVTWADLFHNPVDQRRTLVACIIWIVYQCGGNGFTSNGLYFLNQVGISINLVFKIIISMLALSTATNLLAGYLLERFGRRACFVYANILHMFVLATIGGLGFIGYASAGGWVSQLSRFIYCVTVDVVSALGTGNSRQPCYFNPTISNGRSLLRLSR
jgi:SP family general alpha glucoside:H+ symporter-like MFS transporter